jgi:hypothetical protein
MSTKHSGSLRGRKMRVHLIFGLLAVPVWVTLFNAATLIPRIYLSIVRPDLKEPPYLIFSLVEHDHFKLLNNVLTFVGFWAGSLLWFNAIRANWLAKADLSVLMTRPSNKELDRDLKELMIEQKLPWVFLLSRRSSH